MTQGMHLYSRVACPNFDTMPLLWMIRKRTKNRVCRCILRKTNITIRKISNPFVHSLLLKKKFSYKILDIYLTGKCSKFGQGVEGRACYPIYRTLDSQNGTVFGRFF